jgi:hypothetical protein
MLSAASVAWPGRLEGVDAQAPALPQQPQLGLGQVEAQQVQRRGEQEQQEEAAWKAGGGAAGGLPRHAWRAGLASTAHLFRPGGHQPNDDGAHHLGQRQRGVGVVGQRVDTAARQAPAAAGPGHQARGHHQQAGADGFFQVVVGQAAQRLWPGLHQLRWPVRRATGFGAARWRLDLGGGVAEASARRSAGACWASGS